MNKCTLGAIAVTTVGNVLFTHSFTRLKYKEDAAYRGDDLLVMRYTLCLVLSTARTASSCFRLRSD
eukprot:m.303932 g.303932  ORF g.303932 m.303932 type:complete len:66 (+) comp15894_c0_seq17:3852-4049(+)